MRFHGLDQQIGIEQIANNQTTFWHGFAMALAEIIVSPGIIMGCKQFLKAVTTNVAGSTDDKNSHGADSPFALPSTF